jgi:hypothetical protein
MDTSSSFSWHPNVGAHEFSVRITRNCRQGCREARASSESANGSTEPYEFLGYGRLRRRQELDTADRAQTLERYRDGGWKLCLEVVEEL